MHCIPLITRYYEVRHGPCAVREVAMKKDIHPNYVAAKISCACGASFETRSSKGDYSVDVCSMCHPYYTGKMKLVDTQGRVERFRRKYAAAAKTETVAEKKPAQKKQKVAPVAPAEAPAETPNTEQN